MTRRGSGQNHRREQAILSVGYRIAAKMTDYAFPSGGGPSHQCHSEGVLHDRRISGRVGRLHTFYAASRVGMMNRLRQRNPSPSKGTALERKKMLIDYLRVFLIVFR